MAACAPTVLAAAGSGPAHLVLKGTALSPRLVSPRAEPSISRHRAPAQQSREGDTPSGSGASPLLREVGLGWRVVGGGRRGGSPGAGCRIRIPAAVTQCCRQSPADQDLGLGCGQQLCLLCMAEAVVPPGLGLTPGFLLLRVLR